jgi:hypothetical protein
MYPLTVKNFIFKVRFDLKYSLFSLIVSGVFLYLDDKSWHFITIKWIRLIKRNVEHSHDVMSFIVKPKIICVFIIIKEEKYLYEDRTKTKLLYRFSSLVSCTIGLLRKHSKLKYYKAQVISKEKQNQ